VEGLLFFIMAIILFSFYQGLPESPNLSLIFDSQGYLAMASASQKLFSGDFLSAIASYVASGFSEPSRLTVLNKLGSAYDLAFSGPVVPVFLASVYTLFGKQATTQNWLIGANSMLVLSAGFVPLIWFTARQFWGAEQARLAAILALTYPPLAINSWRILGDVTTCFASCLLLAFFAQLIMNRRNGLAATALGFFTGVTIILLMLGKAPLMLLPWLVIAEIYILTLLLKVSEVFNIQYFIGILVGCVITLSPWLLITQVITGHPSVIVDRGGAYNLWVGCNLHTDGWDILPSRFVAHPKEFKKTSAEVRSELLTTFKQKPLSFIDLMARKPARLMCAPWNDFQNSFFGIGWLWQKWWQEVLLLLAAAGALISLRVSIVRRDFKEIAPIIVLSTFVLYFLLYAPVISMSRYFYPAIPALILLSSQGLFWLITQIRKPAFMLLAVTTLLLPLGFIFIDPSLSANSIWLGRQVAKYGIGNVALLGSTIVVIELMLWFWLASLSAAKVARLEPFGLVLERHHLLLWLIAKSLPLAVLMGALLCAAASTRQELFCLEWAKQLTGTKSIESKIYVPRHAGAKSWYLVVDAIGTGSNPSGERRPQLDFQINGKHIPGKLSPLWALDCSQRDNLVYLKAFAYGQGKNVENIRQWWTMPVPDKFVHERNNQITVSSGTSDLDRPIVFGDFVTPQGEPGGHNLSLRNFSWCKGFFADCVGEMRMDSIKKPRGLTNIWFQTPKIRPRIRLLAIADGAGADSFDSREVFLPDQSLNKSKVMADIALPESALDEINRLSAESTGPIAVAIEVSAEYKADKTSRASICVVENLDDVTEDMASTQYAPQAPSVLRAMPSSQTVSFVDVLPLSTLRGQEPARLRQIRVLMSGVNWWDLLSYGQFKHKAAIDFENLSLRLTPIRVFNLDKQSYEEYQSQLIN